jgi:hypothetical protein
VPIVAALIPPAMRSAREGGGDASSVTAGRGRSSTGVDLSGAAPGRANSPAATTEGRFTITSLLGRRYDSTLASCFC